MKTTLFSKKLVRLLVLVLPAVISLSSCAVTNNFYVNDPVATGKGVKNVYLGLSSGVVAMADSADNMGNVYFIDRLEMAPNLNMGGQVALTPRVDLRVALHLPYFVGGLGLRAGAQYAFFSPDRAWQMAVGTDLGIVFAENPDNINISGAQNAAGTYNADLFLSMAYQFNENTRLIVTPRYSFTSIEFRQPGVDTKARYFNSQLPALVVGWRSKRFYAEVSAFRYQNDYYPNFGVAYLFQ